MTKLFLILFFTGFPLFTMAASMIESRDDRGQTSRIYIQGNKARIEMPQDDGFVVVDVANKTMKVVLHQQRIVMDMSSMLTSDGSNSQTQKKKYIDSYTKSKGLGPKVAGYETEEYEYYADKQYCGSFFLSVRALNDFGLRQFADAFQGMTDNIQKNITGMTGSQINMALEPCEQAIQQVENKLSNIGFPLRVVNENKKLETEVTKLLKNTTLPANAFVIPAAYKVTNPQKMMNEAMKSLPKNMPNNMNLQDLMKNLPPEAREMMRKQMQK